MHTERATTASILFKMINSQQRGKKFTRLVKLHGTRGWAGVAYTRGSLPRSLSHREQLPSFPAPPGKETNCDRWECENGCLATSATSEISCFG